MIESSTYVIINEIKDKGKKMKNISKETLLKNKVEFIILGTDYTSYGLARIIHESYDMKAICFGSKPLRPTSNSKILDRMLTDNFQDPKIFVETMIKYGKENKGKKLIVFPVSDIYTGLLSDHVDVLKEYFYFNVPTIKNRNDLLNKKDFYEQCDKYGIAYPKTQAVETVDQVDFSKLTYPLVLKYGNNVMYHGLRFEGKQKVYFIENKDELIEKLKLNFENGYTDYLIIQDFVPGGTTNTMSLNAFCDQEGKVRMMALGQVLLEDADPLRIGNNNAIYTVGNQELFNLYENFLNKLDYRGFANFDLKYDERNDRFITFEVNVRFPASVFFIYAGGCNFLDFYVRDFLGIPFEEEVYYHSKTEKLYANCDPSVIKKYVDPEYKVIANNLLKRGVKYTLWYEKDKNLSRWMYVKKRKMKTIKDFNEHGKLQS